VIVTIRSYLAPGTGYGQVAEQFGVQLDLRGVDVRYDPYGVDQRHVSLSPFVLERLGQQPGGVALQITTPDHIYDRSLPTCYFTMWETTGLPEPPFSLAFLNAAQRVVVPSRWNRDNFQRCGVTTPISVCPLGIGLGGDLTPIPPDGPTVFGFAARLKHGGARKGLSEAIRAFLDAFPTGRESVELRVKVWPGEDAKAPQTDDPRIVYETEAIPAGKVSQWYEGITCLFAPSKAEGWGLHSLEAMSRGRPVIAARYSGTAEYFDASCGWELDYNEAPAIGFYEGTGDWAIPRHESMVAALRAAHADRQACITKGRWADARAAKFTWATAGETLYEILAEVEAEHGAG